MQRRSLRRILGQPALHIVLALAFGAAFAWPMFVLTRPTQTVYFLYAAWLAAILAAFALSRGQSPEQIRDVAGGGAKPLERGPRAGEEGR